MKLKSLAAMSPRLASEWHRTKNGPIGPEDVSAMSRKTVWWTCDKEHTWQASVLERQKGLTCPKCSPFGTSMIEQRIWSVVKGVFPDAEHRADVKVRRRFVEVDIWIPSLPLAIEYDGIHHVKRIRQDEEKNFLLAQVRIPTLRIRADALPNIEWHGAYVVVHNSTCRDPLSECLRSLGECLVTHFNLSEEQMNRIANWS